MIIAKLPLTAVLIGSLLTTAWSKSSADASDDEATVLSVSSTAYHHNEADHLAWGVKSAIGTPLRSSTEYNSAAADWSRFPVGTKFRIQGHPKTYVVDDYGSALVGKNTVDLYCTTASEMNRWGRRTVNIEILEWGSFERSRGILKARTKVTHCRTMYQALEKKSDA